MLLYHNELYASALLTTNRPSPSTDMPVMNFPVEVSTITGVLFPRVSVNVSFDIEPPVMTLPLPEKSILFTKYPFVSVRTPLLMV
ncbi:hypothetical protein Barb6XT_02260 [Bacteroidales bacterium Barb6XT]|nr:hypothetical protein Barb6XT_02260 [Bacteroidales bacterium Barb6XT]